MVYVGLVGPRGKKGPTYGLKNRINKPKTWGKKNRASYMPEAMVPPFRSGKCDNRILKVKEEKKIVKTETQQALDASDLSLDKLSIGMLVLGCVKRICKTQLELLLPGRITGLVPISDISDAYSKRVENLNRAADCPSLRDLYSVGELVYVKVLQTFCKTKGRLLLTLKPTNLHSTYVHWQLVPGLVLAATIVAKQDNGYTMDVGVRNVSAFLSFENLGQNKDDVGRNLFCSIVSVSQRGSGATVILKAFDPDAPRVLDVEETNLDMIVPGCKLMFTVTEPVAHGLRGMLFEDTVPAYVNETMLTKVSSTPAKYSMFKKIPATLLYVMPLTKQVFVSLRPYPKNRVEVNVTNSSGTIIDKAYVKSCDGAGVWLQFQNKQRALLPRNIILKQAASSGGQVDENFFMENFQIGSTHKVVITYHHLFEDTYVVTNDPSYIDNAIQSPDDIIIGNIYKCRVRKIVHNGVIVNVGCVSGALLNEYYDREHRVKLNDNVLVRAVYREAGSSFVKFTNVPALLDEKASVLYDWDQLDATQTEQSFVGTIFMVTFNKVIVKFFNGMTGALDKWENNIAKVDQLRPNTFETFTVIDFDKATKQIRLKLATAEEINNPDVVVNATVQRVHANGVDVRTENGETGTIPSDCFSEFGEHNSLYMKLLHKGETLTVAKIKSGTYSFRLVPYFKTHPMSIESVEKGALLKGSCNTVNGVMYVTPLFSNFSKRYEVNMKPNYRAVEDGSIIKLRVINVSKYSANGYDLSLKTKLHDVCENGIVDCYTFLAEYLKDVNDLIQRYQRKEKYSFANFKIGQHVKCVVESIVPESNKLAVKVHAIDKKFAAKGFATAILPDQPASSYKVGKKVPGRVVWIDVEQKLVHVCVDQSLFDRFETPDTKYHSNFTPTELPCWVLFANNYVRVCCLQSGTPNTLLVVPVKHHYNDFESGTNNGTNTMNVLLIKPMAQMFFAVLPKHYKIYVHIRNRAIDFERRKEITGAPKESLIRCRQTAKSFDDSCMIEEDKSDAEEVCNEEEGKDVDEDDDKDEEKDEDYVTSNDESNNEMSAKMPTAMSTSNGKQQKKGSVLKPSKNGNDKSIMKRKAVDAYKESAPKVQLPLKQKKKKASPAEVLETAPVAKVPKLASKKTKKSMLLLGKEKKTKKSSLEKKNVPFEIDQLDGASDFDLQQLDGTEDSHITPSVSKVGAQKRKSTADGKGLPGATNFWDSTPVYKRSAIDSSDDEGHSSDDEQCETVSKKRTTGKERFEAMKQEEQRLRKIEDELANPSVDPHTPDQFERLVLAQPNNSMLWIRYMAFHMESAELEKARAVGRKGLKAIHFREETDRLNVWVALLNLEIRYETVESFKEVLQEAVQYNDAFKVYTRVVDILIDCQKHAEVQELLELLLKKFRKQNEMWFLVADAWYRIGQGSKVKPLLSQALKSLPTRDHIPMIVKFAFLHNRNENRDEAHLLFEQILTSYPKRTDIWSQYIDMLVKDNLVGNARQILERAIMQRLPMKNMKTLYTKYVNFEEKHGDRDSVRRVKQMAADYVQAQLNNAGIK